MNVSSVSKFSRSFGVPLMPCKCQRPGDPPYRSLARFSGQATTRTPLPSIRLSNAAKPGRLSIGSAPLTAGH